MSVMASQITSLTVVYSTVYSRHRSKKTSKLRVTGLCAGNSPVTGEFPAQRASNAENVSIWWRHHVKHVMFIAVTVHKGHCFSNHRLPNSFLGDWQPKNNKTPPHWPFVRGICPVWGKSGGFPSQSASNAESVSMLWRHHLLRTTMCVMTYLSLNVAVGNESILTLSIAIDWVWHWHFKTMSEWIYYIGLDLTAYGQSCQLSNLNENCSLLWK